MRAPREAFWLVVIAVLGCSTSPGEPTRPTDGKGNPLDRRFAYEKCPLPQPAESPSGDTFDSIYTDLLADTGVARCQNGTCHGGPTGQLGLAMQYDKAGAYCGMVGYGLVSPSVDCSGQCPSVCTEACTVAVADRVTPECCFITKCSTPSTAAGFEVTALVNIVSPSKSGKEAIMPRDVCGGDHSNRKLSPPEIARITAWGMKGAAFD